MEGNRSKIVIAVIAFAIALAIPLWTVPGESSAPAAASASAAGSGGSGAAGGSAGGAMATGSNASQSSGSQSWQAAYNKMKAWDSKFPARTAGQGGQLLQPQILPDGTKVFHLTTKIVKWETTPGHFVQAWTYNGVVPGPTLYANVGDKIRVVVKNELPEPTVVHWHGLQVPNNMDGVPFVTQDPIKPGATYTYAFTATRPAVSWYHSHYDGTLQVTNGLFGAILFGHMPVPAGVHVSQTYNMELQDAGNLGLTINGKSFPATQPVRAHLGDWVEVNYINAGTMAHPMHLHGLDQIVIAKDGFPLPAPYTADTVNVAPGERYTVLIHADHPGHWAWHCHIFPHSENEMGMFGLFTEMWVS